MHCDSNHKTTLSNQESKLSDLFNQMIKNEFKYDDSEYVFVKFETNENQSDGNNMMKRLEFSSSNEYDNTSPEHVDARNDSNSDDDDFSLSSFDLCDEDLAIDTSNAEMQNVKEAAVPEDSDDGSLHLSQSPSVASVCTDTMFDTMKEHDRNYVTADDNLGQKTKTKNSRPRSSSNANSTASTSTSCGKLSRLSNKKRRKQIKQQKKAAAAAAAAEALASQSVNQTKDAPVSTHITNFSTAAIPKMKKKSNATSIAVLCATQSLVQYRQEIGLVNVNASGNRTLNNPKTMKTPETHALNIIRSI
jgi:hypothetical protein